MKRKQVLLILSLCFLTACSPSFTSSSNDDPSSNNSSSSVVDSSSKDNNSSIDEPTSLDSKTTFDSISSNEPTSCDSSSNDEPTSSDSSSNEPTSADSSSEEPVSSDPSIEEPTSGDSSSSTSTATDSSSDVIDEKHNITFTYSTVAKSIYASIVGKETTFAKDEEVWINYSEVYGYRYKSLTITTVDSKQTITPTRNDSGTLKFNMPDEDVNIHFVAEKRYLLTSTVDEHVTISGLKDAKEYYDINEAISFTLSFASGYELDQIVFILDDNTKFTNYTVDGETYTFNFPSSNLSLNVTSKKKESSGDEKTDPFSANDIYQGSYEHPNDYSCTCYLTLTFLGDSKLNWSIDYQYEEEEWTYDDTSVNGYKHINSLVTNFYGNRNNDSNVSYTYDSINDQFSFSAKVGYNNYKDVSFQINRDTSNNVKNLKCLVDFKNDDYSETENCILYK